MKSAIGCGLAAIVAALWLATPAAAAHRNVLSEAARMVDGGRATEVLVSQAELGTNINPSMVDVAMGGGLLGVVIDAKIDSDRTKKAESVMTAVREALSDFDADQLAIDTTKRATAALPWFQANSQSFGRDSSVWGKSAVLTASSASQVAFFEYTYDTSADFSSIRVGATISLANKAAPNGDNPDSRLAGRNLVYAETITSVVQLPHATTIDENAARWAANDGALAKRALTAAFGEVGGLIPRAMTLGEDDLKTMSSGDRKTIAHFSGKVQEDGPGGTLLFNGGFIHVQTLSE